MTSRNRATGKLPKGDAAESSLNAERLEPRSALIGEEKEEQSLLRLDSAVTEDQLTDRNRAKLESPKGDAVGSAVQANDTFTSTKTIGRSSNMRPKRGFWQKLKMKFICF